MKKKYAFRFSISDCHILFLFLFHHRIVLLVLRSDDKNVHFGACDLLFSYYYSILIIILYILSCFSTKISCRSILNKLHILFYNTTMKIIMNINYSSTLLKHAILQRAKLRNYCCPKIKSTQFSPLINIVIYDKIHIVRITFLNRVPKFWKSDRKTCTIGCFSKTSNHSRQNGKIPWSEIVTDSLLVNELWDGTTAPLK